VTAPGEALPAAHAGGPEHPVATGLVCAGCGAVPAPDDPFPVRCPARRPGDDIDHVMVRTVDLGAIDPGFGDDPDPFVRYRTLFRAYHLAVAAGWSDERYVELVGSLQAALERVDGRRLLVTPFGRADDLSDRLGFAARGGVWVKDETGNPGGSHKVRHLLGVMLELRVAEAAAGLDPDRPLAIASCGNAALAAAVVARAAERRLLVLVPESADPWVLARLEELGAEVRVCPRQPGETGDPSYLRLQEALAGGAIPFTCQGPDDGLVIEGGATLGWEVLDGLRAGGRRADRIVIQVGGGAFASSIALATSEGLALGVVERLPVLDTVQTEGGWPLARAFEQLLDDLGATEGVPVAPGGVRDAMAAAARRRSRYMWPWETEPHSVAHGILDDETYDWLAVARAMLESGGRPVVVGETTLEAANHLARETTGIDADHTGTAGLAGLMRLIGDGLVAPTETVVVVFSGARRPSPPTPAMDQ
jgi:threonine synthase